MIVTLAVLATIVLLAALSTEGMRRYAHRRDLLDIPNERSSHELPTPRGGGAVIAAGWLLAVPILGWKGLLDGRTVIALLGAAPIALLGWVDDHMALRPTGKLGVQFLCAVWTVGWLGGASIFASPAMPVFFGWLAALIAVIGLVWLTNLYNFMDGIDGLAGIEALTVAAAYSLVFWRAGDVGLAVASAILAAAAAGFLTRNWPPAKIFMGDVGSLLTGFAFGAMALAAQRRGSGSAVLLLAPLTVFICDATYTLFRRARRGERVWEAHKSHVYQRLVQQGWAHRGVTSLVAGVNIVLAAITLLAAKGIVSIPQLLLIAVAGVTLTGALALRRGFPTSTKSFEPATTKTVTTMEAD